MLNASPIRRAPGLGTGTAGMLLFGIDRIFPFSTAARNDACNFSGNCQKNLCFVLLQSMSKENSFLGKL
jgi:hypothetical protein